MYACEILNKRSYVLTLAAYYPSNWNVHEHVDRCGADVSPIKILSGEFDKVTHCTYTNEIMQ
jgi:hypothetical protein